MGLQGISSPTSCFNWHSLTPLPCPPVEGVALLSQWLVWRYWGYCCLEPQRPDWIHSPVPSPRGKCSSPDHSGGSPLHSLQFITMLLVLDIPKLHFSWCFDYFSDNTAQDFVRVYCWLILSLLFPKNICSLQRQEGWSHTR